jgi:PKD repeat protein
LIRHFLIAGILLILSFSGKSQAPVANFSVSASTGCAPLGVVFKDESTGNPKFWNWDFGNGMLSNQQNPTAVYFTPGTYNVRLVVRNSDGTDGITKTGIISVFPSPVANFKADYTTACAPITIQFTDQSSSQGAITSWTWEFGDGTTSTLQNPTKLFTQDGYYNVSLTVTTANGCKSIAPRNRFIRIIAGIIPKFDFTRVGTCNPPVVANFINQTTGPGSLSFNWDFGDGQTSTLRTPTNSYSALGTYNVKLQVQSNLGCKSEIIKPITFGATNTQIGAPDSSCPNRPINFTNTSTPAPVSSIWNFGDGSPQSTQLNPVKTYTTPGTYTVTLTSKYAGCSGTITKNIVITKPPAADFTSANPVGCKLPYTVTFQSNSPGAVSYLWNFGDGFTDTSPNPSHTYTRTGNFNVTLSIVTSTGCPATIVKMHL